MKIQVLSDLHREMWGAGADPVRHPDADVVVLAGDIDVRTKAHDFVMELAEGEPVIYVPGNHEFYGGCVEHVIPDLCGWEAENPNVYVLAEGDIADIKGVRFVGGTLWTAMRVKTPSDLWFIERGMNDFRRISTSGGTNQYHTLRPQDTVKWHTRQRSRIHCHLTSALKAGVPTVMVTHHAPCQQGEGPEHSGGVFSPAYWSDLRPVFRAGKPLLAIHGHTHHKHDTDVAGVRVVSNPRGYPDAQVAGFDPNYLVAIEAGVVRGRPALRAA